MPEFKRGTENEIWQIVQENVKIFFMHRENCLLTSILPLCKMNIKGGNYFLKSCENGKDFENDIHL